MTRSLLIFFSFVAASLAAGRLWAFQRTPFSLAAATYVSVQALFALFCWWADQQKTPFYDEMFWAGFLAAMLAFFVSFYLFTSAAERTPREVALMEALVAFFAAETAFSLLPRYAPRKEILVWLVSWAPQALAIVCFCWIAWISGGGQMEATRQLDHPAPVPAAEVVTARRMR